MSKLTRYSDFGRINDFPTFAKFCSSAFSDLVDIVNGNIDFDSNINCVFMDVTFTAVNTSQSFTHTLGKVPSGFIVTVPKSGGVIYQGTADWTVDSISLKATSPEGGTILIF